MENNNNVVTLFTINCPKCKVLESKLNKANISYAICNDIQEMKKLGIDTLPFPILRVNDKIMEFMEAVNWINNSSI